MAQRHDIKVYSKDNCQQCRATIRHLDKRGIEYELLDATDPTNFTYITEVLGRSQAPVVEANIRGAWESWSGFRPELLDEYIAGAQDERYGASGTPDA